MSNPRDERKLVLVCMTPLVILMVFILELWTCAYWPEVKDWLITKQLIHAQH